MKTSEILRAWRKILKGERPSLSIEINKPSHICLNRITQQPR